MHGVNEIHGQHFRHHPPGAKSDGTVNGELTPVSKDRRPPWKPIGSWLVAISHILPSPNLFSRPFLSAVLHGRQVASARGVMCCVSACLLLQGANFVGAKLVWDRYLRPLSWSGAL